MKLSNLNNTNNTNSNKSSDFNSKQRKLGASLREFLQLNLFYPEKQNKNGFWQQLVNKNDTITIKHSDFKGYDKIIYYLDTLSPTEIENTFRFAIQQFSNSDLQDRNFVFQDK
ncbi:MAG TPA: hypothetical protein VFV86_08115 [Nitrososphaeraceae archaeon]|nr:hypothetical protein [Nitrososphaeraceae archaeon]